MLGFAEKLFSIDPRPSALSIEKVISNLVLFDVLIQVILIGYILVDDFVCNEKHTSIIEALESPLPPKPATDEYLGQVCGTQIRVDAQPFFIEKFIFLFFFLAIFYLNKSFISRINRYHVIVMKENIKHFISMSPIYVDVDYERRWKITIAGFFVYKVVTIIFLTVLIVAAFTILYTIDEVKDLLGFKGVECGPDMDFVDDIDIKLICHFEHEFLIRVFSYITNILAILILVLYILSVVSLLYYVKKFFSQQDREDELDRKMIAYKKVGDHVKRDLSD